MGKKKKKKTFLELMKPVKDGLEEISYETTRETVRRFQSYLPNVRERILKDGNLLLSMKKDGRMYYKLATGEKKEKKWVIKAVLQYKKRVTGAKQKGRKERAETRYNRVIEIIRKKELLDEDSIKGITEGGEKWMEDFLVQQDWTSDLTEERKRENEVLREDRLFEETMDEANKKMTKLEELGNEINSTGLPSSHPAGLPSAQKMRIQLKIIELVMDEWEDAKDERDKFTLRKRLTEEQKRFILLADEIVKEAKGEK